MLRCLPLVLLLAACGDPVPRGDPSRGDARAVAPSNAADGGDRGAERGDAAAGEAPPTTADAAADRSAVGEPDGSGPGDRGASGEGDAGIAAVPPPDERTQFVLMSIDSTPSPRRPLEQNGFYQLFRALNRHRDPALPPNSFTLFISSGGLQFDPARRNPTDEERRFLGVEPRNAPVMHYAESLEVIRGRADNARELAAEGVEIACHGVRHAHGAEWTAERWRFEFEDHLRVLGLLGVPPPSGFRAPFLEWNEALFPVMESLGMRYDASGTGDDVWPERASGTRVWVFSVPGVTVSGGRRVLFFDLVMEANLRAAAAQAGVSDEAAVRDWVDDAYVEAGYSEFLRRYQGERSPFLISGHGIRLEPVRRLMSRLCDLPQVRCATFREAVDYLDAHPELAGVGD